MALKQPFAEAIMSRSEGGVFRRSLEKLYTKDSMSSGVVRTSRYTEPFGVSGRRRSSFEMFGYESGAEDFLFL
jgi:hypothetical protein